MLAVENIEAGYGTFRILFGVSISVESKSIVAIVGPNGSGKSTLLKAIVGQANVFGGRIAYERMDITNFPTYKLSQLGIVYIPQTDNVFAMLTVRENIRMAGYGSKTNLQARISAALETFPMLEPWLDRKAITLSGGERQILALAMALEKHPKMILFDEPTAHLAPLVAVRMLKKIVELRDRLGISIVIVEQNTRKALEISDYAYLLTAGKVALGNESRTLLSNPELGKLYFGEQTSAPQSEIDSHDNVKQS